ncbi:hypothetical protein AB0H71_06790 [Nocardia sp. NPDC050697]|uniref:hypothetical protein n=1 Tax=Nocardia sp. NPDC050697 TaxID=3155158 RepID=UPI0033DE217A
MSAQDAVPTTLWTAATFLNDCRAAIAACVEAGGAGRGYGTARAFAGTVLAAVRREFPDTSLRAVVQEWNTRCLRLLTNLGFTANARHEARGIGYLVLTAAR